MNNEIPVEIIYNSILIFFGKKNKLCSFKENNMSVVNILLLINFLGEEK